MKKELEKIVVTRHPTLVEYLIEIGVIEKDTPVIEYAQKKDVQGKHVYGPIPIRLADVCDRVTAVEVITPYAQPCRELSLEELRTCVKKLITYQTRIIGVKVMNRRKI